ncbi:MAG: hypothetical protein RL346_389 [Verrucomicrobiota bacterium]|jgi:hypothetical protein
MYELSANREKAQTIARSYYSDPIENFLKTPLDEVLGKILRHNEFEVLPTQRTAWVEQIKILKKSLIGINGWLHFEFIVPRMGHRIDVVLIIDHIIFPLEFKVGETRFHARDREQVWDYGLDLKNFHESSHSIMIAPILIATDAVHLPPTIQIQSARDNLLEPLAANAVSLRDTIDQVIGFSDGEQIDAQAWAAGRYSPTPTILEAARALYNGHGVEAISRSDATATNLSTTSECIENIIQSCMRNGRKAICFVTGVPGAGKTLVGLNVATRHRDKDSALYSVFLSGNGPLVEILCEALARDKVAQERAAGRRSTLKESRSEMKAFVQNVHHFRDACLSDLTPPIEHVALFDEAQRAWNLEQTTSFMKKKKGVSDFNQSEPEFLISCLDRHNDWAVVVCLVGGGQEINTGEAGISEWINARNRSFQDWDVHVSSRLTDPDYAVAEQQIYNSGKGEFHEHPELHLSVSLRSFRAEHLSRFVKELLDQESEKARKTYAEFALKYPIMLTRDLSKAKTWLRSKARGSERYGIVVSSQAMRLKPHAIDVRVKTDPVNWFLNDRDDVRSSFYLEDIATEFDVQGLELDWTCVVWDGDLRFTDEGWQHQSFKGAKWQRILNQDRKRYLLNAYRVLLTRARQGMVIVVPHGNPEDPTRMPSYYDSTFNYLESLGLENI